MVSKKSKLIFLMPPKTASNSLTECLLDSSIKFDKLDVKYPKIHLFLSELVEAHHIENVDEYTIIQVTREPIDRYISSYFHQLKLISKAKTKLNDLNFVDFTQHLHQCLLYPNFLENFYGNLKFVSSVIKSGRSWAGSRLYLNQIQWNDLNMPIHYFKLEELQDGLKPISDLIGVYLPDLTRKNIGKKQKIDLSKESIEILKTIFDSDLNILGYDKDYSYL